MGSLLNRGLKPASTLAADKPHGTRIKYMGGCRCAPCKAANTAYERERSIARKQGDWNGLVPASRARQHILALSRDGVGRKAVCAASDVAESIVVAIRSGQKTQIRAQTERKILAVTRDARSGHALVPAIRTWRLIDKMLRWGYSKSELAKRLGYANRALQFQKTNVTVRNAFDVQQLYNAIVNEREAEKLAKKKTLDMGYEQKVIRRSGKVDLQKPASLWQTWGGYRDDTGRV
ncbi:MAG: hypothetical protein LBE24_10510 [Methylobacillus sp.]|jgi:hypothetical protein|nr:hypothetical protein [Methylobacillus sp.]